MEIIADIKSRLNGHWQSYNKGIMSGKKDEGFISIRSEIDLIGYITKKLGYVVEAVNLIEKGIRYDYNESNPYTHDFYSVKFLSGELFSVTIVYGRPLWSGNVDYIERVEFK